VEAGARAIAPIRGADVEVVAEGVRRRAHTRPAQAFRDASGPVAARHVVVLEARGQTSTGPRIAHGCVAARGRPAAGQPAPADAHAATTRVAGGTGVGVVARRAIRRGDAARVSRPIAQQCDEHGTTRFTGQLGGADQRLERRRATNGARRDLVDGEPPTHLGTVDRRLSPRDCEHGTRGILVEEALGILVRTRQERRRAGGGQRDRPAFRARERCEELERHAIPFEEGEHGVVRGGHQGITATSDPLTRGALDEQEGRRRPGGGTLPGSGRIETAALRSAPVQRARIAVLALHPEIALAVTVAATVEDRARIPVVADRAEGRIADGETHARDG